jgi:hypothetical protein
LCYINYMENTSGQGKNAVVPPELLGKFNWGAFTWGSVWYFSHGVSTFDYLTKYIAALGWEGNAIAWRNKRWESVAVFQQTQRRWAWSGLIIWLGFTAYLLGFLIYWGVRAGSGASVFLNTILPLFVVFGFLEWLRRYMKPRSPAEIPAPAVLSAKEKERRKKYERRWIWIAIIIFLVLMISFYL